MPPRAASFPLAEARPGVEVTPDAEQSLDWRLQIPESRRRPLRIWLWTIAAFTLLVVAIGGATRLTHSGLSIVDWEPIVGVIPPLTAGQWEQAFERYRAFPEYQQLRRGMTLAEFKFIFFWEYVHRLAARLIGIVFAIPFLYFWVRGYLTGPLTARTLALFALGGAQGLVGWLMVQSGLVDRPSVSHIRLAAHLALAVAIFCYSIWLARGLAIGPPAGGSEQPRARAVLILVGVLLGAQVIYGAFVAGLKAGLLFNTFPLMNGRLVPSGVFTSGLAGFVNDPAAVQWVHRLLGTLLLAAVLALWAGVRRRGDDPYLRRLSSWLAGLVTAQYLLGVLTLVFAVPVPLGVAHQVLAVLICGVWVGAVGGVRSRFSIQRAGSPRDQA